MITMKGKTMSLDTQIRKNALENLRQAEWCVRYMRRDQVDEGALSDVLFYIKAAKEDLKCGTSRNGKMI